jgi:hypothetical protein
MTLGRRKRGELGGLSCIALIVASQPMPAAHTIVIAVASIRPATGGPREVKIAQNAAM